MAITIPTSLTFFRWRPACWLRVTGEDAARFLQGQFTNDLRRLNPGDTAYGLWLSVKGKVLADSFVRLGANEGVYWIGSYWSPVETIRARLESYVIADDVMLEDQTGAWAGVSLLGNVPEALVAQAAQEGAIVFRARRDRGDGIECVYDRSRGQPAILAAAMAQGRELKRDEMERRRIAAGIPAIPVDAGPGDLPNEAALEADAISYTKGCYLGQEVMARLKAMGQVRRRLRRVQGSDVDVPAAPAPLFAEGRQVGELRSAVGDGAGGWMGLAMISLLALGSTTRVALAEAANRSVAVLEGP
ncbi:MAG: folate-binding protein [Opitutaceae bacterium]|nr:folate-binding protein [Opitutaceae bacterium]